MADSQKIDAFGSRALSKVAREQIELSRELIGHLKQSVSEAQMLISQSGKLILDSRNRLKRPDDL